MGCEVYSKGYYTPEGLWQGIVRNTSINVSMDAHF